MYSTIQIQRFTIFRDLWILEPAAIFPPRTRPCGTPSFANWLISRTCLVVWEETGPIATSYIGTYDQWWFSKRTQRRVLGRIDQGCPSDDSVPYWTQRRASPSNLVCFSLSIILMWISSEFSLKFKFQFRVGNPAENHHCFWCYFVSFMYVITLEKWNALIRLASGQIRLAIQWQTLRPGQKMS